MQRPYPYSPVTKVLYAICATSVTVGVLMLFLDTWWSPMSVLWGGSLVATVLSDVVHQRRPRN